MLKVGDVVESDGAMWRSVQIGAYKVGADGVRRCGGVPVDPWCERRRRLERSYPYLSNLAPEARCVDRAPPVVHMWQLGAEETLCRLSPDELARAVHLWSFDAIDVTCPACIAHMQEEVAKAAREAWPEADVRRLPTPQAHLPPVLPVAHIVSSVLPGEPPSVIWRTLERTGREHE